MAHRGEQALQGIGCGGAVAACSPCLGIFLGKGFHTQWSHVLAVLPAKSVSSGKKQRHGETWSESGRHNIPI